MSTALLKTPLRQVKSVQEMLMNDQARSQLAMVATKHLNPERMMRVMANAIRTTPKLGECEPMTLLGALMQCASLGLEPNTILGHAYLIPFENRKKNTVEVQLIVGYKGLIDLARRSGHITALSANIHYSDDEMWEYEEGTEAQLRHRPGPQAGEKLHAYAIAKFKDGGHAYVVLPWAQIIKTRDGSQGWQTAKRFGKTAESPWGKHEDEMAKKTAIRALAKYLPLSVEFMDAMIADEARADYRGFAMDPTQGLPVEADGFIDGEAVDEETGEVTKIDDRRGQEVSLDQRETDTAAKLARQPRQRRDATPYTQMADQPATDQGQMALDAEQQVEGAQYQGIVDRIAGDLLDGAGPADLLAEFKDLIADMKAKAPGIHKNLEAEIGGYAPDLIGTF